MVRRLFLHVADLFEPLVLLICLATSSSAQTSPQNRICFANREIFLSGINIAWVNFGADLGPNPPDLGQFRKIFQTVRDSGANALRLWLHTNGSETPQYNSGGYVTGPGPVAIQNLKEILDLARHYGVGLILCLWTHNMLNQQQLSGQYAAILNNNIKLLTDTSYTMAYVRNALIPMVDSLKGNPAIISWEIFNEPEGMSSEYGPWSGLLSVHMSDIQRCIDLMAGAIHRADSSALVTSGANTFQTLTDVNPVSSSRISDLRTLSSMSQTQQQKIVDAFNAQHRTSFTTEQWLAYLRKISAIPNQNYYRDDRLIAAGGDSEGTLDFYSVHFYSTSIGLAYSPFVRSYPYWELNKPVVVAEFHMDETNGVPSQYLYPTLYGNGYAGAMAWSWTDFASVGPSSASETWSALNYMWNHYRQDIDVFGADWPTITITNPQNNSSFPDSTQLTITAAVIDTGSSIASVKFFAADSLIGEVDTCLDTISDTLYYAFIWKNFVPGSYTITAIATNSRGQQEVSAPVQFSVGKPLMTKLEAEKAVMNGSGITVKSDPTASGGYFLDIRTSDPSATVTWQFTNIVDSGKYPISFGYKDPYSTDKTQFININGVRADTVTFSMTQTWSEKTLTANLVHGPNTVQMQMSWGWIYLDYLAVPASILSSVASSKEIPLTYSLSQNYPNPFNPTTTISYELPTNSLVTLKVYDVLGREIKTLANEVKKPGKYQVEFDGSHLASGVYFYRINISVNDEKKFVSIKKMLLLK